MGYIELETLCKWIELWLDAHWACFPSTSQRPNLQLSAASVSPKVHPVYSSLSSSMSCQMKPGCLKSRYFVFSLSLYLTAQGQMWGNGAPGGCQRESYSWKALSHSCFCSHDWRRGGREKICICCSVCFGDHSNVTQSTVLHGTINLFS